MNDAVVAVHPVGNRANIAEVELSALKDLHWHGLTEAVMHAYVNPSEVANGDRLASGADSAPVLVCIRSSLNTTSTFARLMDLLEHSVVTRNHFALLV